MRDSAERNSALIPVFLYSASYGMLSGMKHASHSRWPIILAVLTAVIGIGLSLYAHSRVAQVDATKARLTAETLRVNTEQELALFVEVLESVRALHALSGAVGQAAMDEFIKKGMVHQHEVIGAFGLAQRISPQVRSLLEKEAEEQGTGYRVVEQGSNRTWAPAKSKSAYYPLTWKSRTEGLNIPIGFDFSSIDNARQTIKQIEQTRRTALVGEGLRPEALGFRENRSNPQTPSLKPQAFSSSPIGNRKSEIGNASYWVFAPVMPRQSPSRVIGFSVAVLNPETILDRVSNPSGLSPKLKLRLVDSTKPETAETIQLLKGQWIYRHPLKALGAQWMFECSLPTTVTGHRSATALAFGLIITALMTSQLLILGNRTRKIEAEVRARTEDLRIANVHLEENILERARMEEEMNTLAAHERRRIGSDLHDSLGQKLAGAVFLSRSLMDDLSKKEISNVEQGTPNTEGTIPSSGGVPEGRGGFCEHARTLNQTLKSAVTQVRKMARGLAPVALSDESLSSALEQLAEEMTGLYGIPCELTERATLSGLDQKTKEQLYLIAREAVNNAARHAQAKRITVQLNGDDSEWTLRIEDDGKGLPFQTSGLKPHPSPLSSGMGIRIMRHRAHLIGAEFTITSTPDEGTCISVESRTS